MAKYNHLEIEKKWQDVWAKTDIYAAKDDDKREKYYNLVMYPYPSGDLHIGHWYNFSGGDFYARYKRMNGFNVLNPIGFDSFGLPAENAAIKHGIAPKKWTYDNIDNMVKQLHRLGPSYDWDRMVVTSDPEYYKWTQWMFLELYKRGLAYKKKQVANWCTDCNTVLANEQVVNGKCERCGNEVVQKDLDQWLFKITDYADELISGLDKVDWPERTKIMQRNWIGKSEGAQVKFSIFNSQLSIDVFTTRIDTLFGATFMVLAPENPLVGEITTKEQQKEVEKYITVTKGKTELDRMQEKQKTGVFTGSYAINPVNDEKIPIWISDYVLMGYGTGAIMAVPAHDERDFEFAKKFNLPVIDVIAPEFLGEDNATIDETKQTVKRNLAIAIIKHWKEDKYLCLDWKEYNWKTFVVGGVEAGETFEEAAIREAREESGYQNFKSITKINGLLIDKFYAAHKGVNTSSVVGAYLIELADGKFIEPKEGDKKFHTTLWVSKDDVSGYVDVNTHSCFWDYLNRGEIYSNYGTLVNSSEFNGLSSKEAQAGIIAKLGKNKLAAKRVNYKLRDWLISRQRYWGAPIPIVYCEKCGEVPVPEADLPVILPEEVKMKPTGESPLRYEKDFYETTCPQCGGKATRETDTMDTFVCSSWYYLRYADPKNDKVFADKTKIKHWLPVDMYIGGAEHTVLHLLYSRFFTKALRDGGYLDFDEPFMKLRHQGMILGPDGLKMSKSKGNVIDPDKEVDKFGADAVRMYLAFMGPYDQGGPWNPNGLIGTRRFLEKFYDFAQKICSASSSSSSEAKDPEILHSVQNDSVALDRLVAKLVAKVSGDLPEMRFNTCVSTFMETQNALAELEKNYSIKQNPFVWKNALSQMLLTMAPFAPHLTEELWHELGYEDSIHVHTWPVADKSLLTDELITVAIQINGKVRDSLLVSADATENEVAALAKDSEKVLKYLTGKEIKKQFYVKGKILSIVTN